MMKRNNIAKRILRRGESGIALISVLLLTATYYTDAGYTDANFTDAN